VPAIMGSVTRSPSTRIAKPVAMNGFRLMIEAATGAPTFSMLTKRSSRPPAVPMIPDNMKRGMALAR
jgi:hypothetical protein